MKAVRVVAVVCVLVLAAASLAAASPSGPKGKPAKIKVHARGEAFCPAAALVYGNIVIAPGRCYTVYVLRDSRGTFLAFAAVDARIPPGQLVRLNTPAGTKLRGRIFYLVPLRTTAVIVPANTMTLVAFRTEDFGTSLTIILTEANASLVFSVRY